MKLLTVTQSAHNTRINLDNALAVNTGTSSNSHDYIEFTFATELPELDTDELLEGVRVNCNLLTIYDNFESYDYVMAYVVAAEF
jgi:hypothetical protein